eukprot:m.625232 g.625232  ORF g.625232 m.625232 type:complete len:150 (+) comp22547_c0_seq8:1800-2249(+)
MRRLHKAVNDSKMTGKWSSATYTSHNTRYPIATASVGGLLRRAVGKHSNPSQVVKVRLNARVRNLCYHKEDNNVSLHCIFCASQCNISLRQSPQTRTWNTGFVLTPWSDSSTGVVPSLVVVVTGGMYNLNFLDSPPVPIGMSMSWNPAI